MSENKINNFDTWMYILELSYVNLIFYLLSWVKTIYLLLVDVVEIHNDEM